jgi:hypothetical protein
VENLYTVDTAPPKRNNQDKATNARGPELLDLCVSSGLRILNGRKVGDSLGYFTCHKYNGSSTVDYGIVSQGLFPHVQFFHVDKSISDLSDHCKISFALNNFEVDHRKDNTNKIKLENMEGTFKWDNTSIFLYQQALSCPDIKSKISQFTTTAHPSVDEALNDLNHIIQETAQRSLRKRKVRTVTKYRSKKWYTKDLRHLKNSVCNKGKLLCQYQKITGSGVATLAH